MKHEATCGNVSPSVISLNTVSSYCSRSQLA